MLAIDTAWLGLLLGMTGVGVMFGVVARFVRSARGGLR